jgi:hypothetical protein
MRAKTTEELRAIAGWELYEAKHSPKDYTISDVVAREIEKLQAEWRINADNFAISALNLIERHKNVISGYDSQTLKLIKLQASEMIRHARYYKSPEVASKLESFLEDLTKYECSFE